MEAFPEVQLYPCGDALSVLPLGTVEWVEGVDEIPPDEVPTIVDNQFLKYKYSILVLRCLVFIGVIGWIAICFRETFCGFRPLLRTISLRRGLSA